MRHWQNALGNALQAAGRAMAVFPIGSRKLPSIASPHREETGPKNCRGECGRFGHGVHDASTDVEVIRAMFDQARHATGYGIACGQGDTPLLGIDLDRKNGVDGVATLERLGAEHNFTIPRTVAIATPSGGFHLWFTGPAGVKLTNSASKVGPGIDVRGYGGYLVGPGSWTPKGYYRVCSTGEPVVSPVPVPLLQLITPPPAPPQPARRIIPARAARGAAGALVQVVLDAGEGELNNRLFWASCKAFEHVRNGRLDALPIAGALQDAACVKGHPERAARRTINSAHKNVMGADLWTP
ncbi:bifunctional DNA primase/polymerase [Streptomyces sp. NPDC019208]|uniref:bifunctional DNA primase/polymerase n=1 Tax=Streptomyces sp. NPDC019208 TaxID=3154683 RepID=UPI003408CA49